jgi:hypothetical protein
MFKPTPELSLRLLWLGGRRGLTWRWASKGIRMKMFAVLLTMASSSYACTAQDGPELPELLAEGRSAVIITPVLIEAPAAPVGIEEMRRSGVVVHFMEPVVARVRVVEVLVGAVPLVEEVSYHHNSCGGHRLEANRFYVLAVDPGKRRYEIPFGANSLLGLGDEYLEEAGAARSESGLVKALVGYRNTGYFEMADSIELGAYTSLARPRAEFPTTVKGSR